ncbi:MAG: exosortase [Erythrobacter sp.]|jgi:exosortase A|uniref:exosortase A n=1 Tax=Erythrobacter sp. TaxID=1042 RepID=UPI002B471572|nr:exosortase A [Erythrobacter sp.]WRH71148.1 MAG: exosortase [Erythrobacter sp.]
MPPEPAALTLPLDGKAQAIPGPWRTALGLLGLASAALILLAAREWAEMLHQWWNIDTYNHLLLMPPILAWLVLLKADELAQVTPRSFAPGLVLVLAALGLWSMGRALGINLVAQAGAVGMVQGAVVTVLGLRASVLLALPLAMAAFLVPFGDEIIPPLQAITAEIAVTLTHLSGVPARVEGLHIDTPAGLFIVAEACSGVKFLIAMVTLGVLVCFTRFASWRRRAVFLALCVIVPILANGVRAWATIYAAQFIGATRATSFDHIIYGWVFFALITAGLLGAAWRFFEREPETYGWRAADLTSNLALARAETGALGPLGAAFAIIALAVIAALAGLL